MSDKCEYTFLDRFGRQVWRTAKGTTRTDARNERRQHLAGVHRSRGRPCDLTVGEVARLWLERGVGAGGAWEPRTRACYGEVVGGYIERSVDPRLSPLGDVKIAGLTVDRVARWSRANQPTLSVSTATAALGVVRQICRYAERRAGSTTTQ
jgi:hypothetical protein